MKITQDDLESWKASPETMFVFSLIDLEIDEISREITEGRTINQDSAHATAIKTAGMVGRIMGLRKLKDLEIGED